jgi:hypothetical protein
MIWGRETAPFALNYICQIHKYIRESLAGYNAGFLRDQVCYISRHITEAAIWAKRKSFVYEHCVSGSGTAQEDKAEQ